MQDKYELLLATSRSAFDTHFAITRLIGPDMSPDVLEGFLLHFSALGVGMTEPVEGWIERAGHRCTEIGLPSVGAALVSHARHEAGHHTLMIDDTRNLARRWNARRTPRVDPEQLLAMQLPPSVLAYQKLHEDIIAGSNPYGQLAIEYEIEMLSVRIGPRLIKQCIDVLGPDINSALSFIDDHVKLDVGHTKFNRKQLENLLGAHPEFLDALVESGSMALRIYAEFLHDCLAFGESLARSA